MSTPHGPSCAETAGGRTEALRAAIAEALGMIRRTVADEIGFRTAQVAVDTLPALLDAYGDEREKAGAENALREAAESLNTMQPVMATKYVRDWLHGIANDIAEGRVSADEIGGRT